MNTTMLGVLDTRYKDKDTKKKKKKDKNKTMCPDMMYHHQLDPKDVLEDAV